MIAVDSSVVIAAFGGWHEHHIAAREVLRAAPALPAHAGLEAYSVLTRLPMPFRAEPDVVAEFLVRAFPGSRMVLSAEEQAAVPGRLASMGVSGGASYDALIALTARAAGALVATLDRRAAPTYERCGVAIRLLA